MKNNQPFTYRRKIKFLKLLSSGFALNRTLLANKIAFSSGRTGIWHIISSFKNKPLRVLVPSYCPQGIVQPFIESGIDVELYRLDEAMKPPVLEICASPNLNNSKTILIIIDFAFIRPFTKDEISALRKSNIKVWRDFTHNWKFQALSKSTDNTELNFVSLPKLLSVPSGALFSGSAANYKIKSLRPTLLSAFLCQSQIILPILNSISQYKFWALVLKVYSRIFNPYVFLTKQYKNMRQMPLVSKRVFATENLIELSLVQRKVANFYYNKLKKSVILPNMVIEPEDALYLGFPVFCPNRSEVLERLKENKIEPLVLQDCWDFTHLSKDKTIVENGQFYLENLLYLPLRTENEEMMFKAVEIVNELSHDNF